MKRRIIQIMIILIMLFGLTGWRVGGKAPARQPQQPPRISRYELSQNGIKHTGYPPDERRIGVRLP